MAVALAAGMNSRIATCFLLLLAPASAFAFNLEHDGSGDRIVLPSKELTFRLPTRLPPGISAEQAKTAIEAAASAWSEASGVTIKIVPGAADAVPGYSRTAQNYNDILFIDDDWRWDVGAVGVALLAVEELSHTIRHVDILLNATEYEFAVLDGTSKPGTGIAYDLQNAVTHEMGHALGLAHSDVVEAAMYGASTRGEVSKRVLASDDWDGAQLLYQEPDGSARAMGCATAAGRGTPSLWALFGLPLLALRRRNSHNGAHNGTVER
jgi:hypothetical protein